MRVCSTPATAVYPATLWEAYAPESLGGELPLGYRRSISAANDLGRWVFHESGQRFPFEQVERYAERRKRDRFTRDMLVDDLRHFSIELFSDEFLRVDPASPAVQLQQRTKVWHTPEFTLEQVVAGIPWQREEGIEYFLGGSLASTVYGEPRFTQGVDIVVRLTADTAQSLAKEFQNDFYLSESAIAEALACKSSANLIHLATNFKIDLIVSRERAFEKSRFSRKVRHTVGEHSFWFCSAEDIILVKLEWYRKSGHILERQLRDIQTVLMVQDNLDLAYLRLWAQPLGIDDLLESSLKDAGVA